MVGADRQFGGDVPEILNRLAGNQVEGDSHAVEQGAGLAPVAVRLADQLDTAEQLAFLPDLQGQKVRVLRCWGIASGLAQGPAAAVLGVDAPALKQIVDDDLADRDGVGDLLELLRPDHGAILAAEPTLCSGQQLHQGTRPSRAAGVDPFAHLDAADAIQTAAADHQMADRAEAFDRLGMTDPQLVQIQIGDGGDLCSEPVAFPVTDRIELEGGKGALHGTLG